MAHHSINKVMLIGNLGADPETRFTPSGSQVTTVNLATDEMWTDKSGERQTRTEWHRLVLWRRLAEIAGQYLKKGSKIYVEGRLQTRNWDDQNGRRHYVTEIVVTDMQLLDAAGGPGELDMMYGREEEGGASAIATAVSSGRPSRRGRGSAIQQDDGLPF